ncbi:MAG TPA: ParA family protein [Pyrinomonadaceae bacterium]|jgi:chromosome partitioning protein|nr:ParA family protein [Pyrinomonadaceae bacterium]
MMKTIVLANHKGGCAKTTCALNIAVALAAKGARVLAVDLDPQGNLSTALGANLEDLEDSHRTSLRLMLAEDEDFSTFLVNARPRLDLIPSCLDDTAEAMLLGADSRELLLKEKLEPAQTSYNYCIIDTPPSLGTPTLNALAMSDLTIVPVDTGLFSLVGIKQLRRKVGRMSRKYSPEMMVRALSTKFTKRNKIDRSVREEMIKRFGDDYVFETTIPRTVDIEEATALLKSVTESRNDSPAAFAFFQLLKEIKEALGDEEIRTGTIERKLG